MDFNTENVDVTPQADASPAPPSAESNVTESNNTASEKFGLVKSPNGNMELKIFKEESEPADVPSEQEPIQTTPPPQAEIVPQMPLINQKPFGVDAGNEPRAQPYSIADISTAIQAGIPLAQERIPDELVGWYQQKQMEKAQKDVPDAREQQRELFRNIAKQAKLDAMKELNMTEADLTQDLDELDFTEQEELEQKRQALQELTQVNQSMLLNQVQFAMAQQAQERERQMGVVRGIVEYADELKKNEPNFEAINSMMRNHYQTMPYQDAAIIKDAIDALSTGQINQRQADVLRVYYEKTRLAYYAQKNNLTTKPQTITAPPITEKPTNGNFQEGERPDWSSMRNMTSRERGEYFKKFFNY